MLIESHNKKVHIKNCHCNYFKITDKLPNWCRNTSKIFNISEIFLLDFNNIIHHIRCNTMCHHPSLSLYKMREEHRTIRNVYRPLAKKPPFSVHEEGWLLRMLKTTAARWDISLVLMVNFLALGAIFQPKHIYRTN